MALGSGLASAPEFERSPRTKRRKTGASDAARETPPGILGMARPDSTRPNVIEPSSLERRLIRDIREGGIDDLIVLAAQV